MLAAARPRRLICGGAITLVLALGLGAGDAFASGPPVIGDLWSLAVDSNSARLRAELDPNGNFTTFHFDYITSAAYEANLAASKEGFAGALRVPPLNDANYGSVPAPPAQELLFSLTPQTAYRYRVVAHNSADTASSAAFSFTTQPSPGPLLADGRGWEMVSPVDKSGGRVDPPGALAGGGVLQAAAQGGQVIYGSAASFAGGQGAPPASQYIATRAAGGWLTQNITAPIFAGSYDTADQGVPYQLFSGDLTRALLLNGDHCRGEGSDCAVANPPLAGTDAPAGYQDYYLREGSAYTALLGTANAGFLGLLPAHFDLRLAGATPDLRHAVLSTCAALTANATEIPLGEGCDPEEANLYEWSGGALSLVNVLPAETQGTPGAVLAAQAGAISEDGSRVYFNHVGGLYLREAGSTKLLAIGAELEDASANGTVAFYTKPDEHLYRYEAAGAGASTDLTPAGGVKGVLGASADGGTVYYQDASGLHRWHSGSTTTVAAGAGGAMQSDWPPATGTARVSADGTELLFVSRERLTGYDNTDLNSGEADSQVFLYTAGAAQPLACISCNPTGERPLGPSSIPGAIANGTAEGSIDAYKPRVLSAGGKRVFFDSADALVLADTNTDPISHVGIEDAYEWEAQGEGSCARAGGCASLISSGRDPAAAPFIDAPADGADAFFLTADSLVPADPGSLDLYDARIGGGFSEPPPPLACEGDACQPLPSAPIDPTLDTLLSGPGNPPVRYPGVHCRKHFVNRRGECVPRGGGKHRKHKHKHRAKGRTR